ncbi:MAG: ABC transporter transmembrane domain-containing protein [Ignavibacteriales bacterium]
MTDVSETGGADGRPGAGAELAQSLAEAAQRRPKQRDVRPLGHLVPFIRAHWQYALLATFFLLLSTSATLGITGAARVVVDHGFHGGSPAALNRTFLLLGAVAVGLALATACRFYFVSRLGERVVADLRRALYGNILKLDPAYFASVRTGEVLSRMTTDVTIIENMVGSSASVALRNLLTMIGGIAMLAVVSPRLTGFVLLLVPLVLLPLFVIGRQVRRLSAGAQDRFAEAVAYAGESLDALDTVQAFGREASAERRFGEAVEAAFNASMARVRARAWMTAVVITVVFGGVAAVLWAGAHDVITGKMSGGALVQFVFLSVLAAGSVGALGEVWGEVQKAAGAMQRIAEFLKAKPLIAAPAQPKALPTPARGEVALEHVSFAYPGRPDLPALHDFSLHVSPGERVALVGPSGAGKSTVFRLLLRFYDPQEGRVLIDGVDLRDADPAEVRARMALVAQDTPLFSGSAADNIRFGREDASPEEVIMAAEAAQAAGFLASLPQGIETTVGERAKTLSGGQRQRLAIARALIRNAPILLLDEATSALDAENERLVQKALDEAMTGRTTLVIAHRLATVLKADRIIVMDEGRVAEQGTHAELSARGGLYAKLAKLQFGGEAA